MVEKIIRYKTSDGRMFDDLELAEKHEEILGMMTYLNDNVDSVIHVSGEVLEELIITIMERTRFLDAEVF